MSIPRELFAVHKRVLRATYGGSLAMVWRSFLVLTMAMVPLMPAAAQNKPVLPKDLTLSQALEIALRNSSALREAEANLEQASGQYKQARSELLPQIGIVARQGYLRV